MTFSYKPLTPESREIRVLTIQHDGLHTQVRCTLEHQSVDQEYHCLSYVWGDPEPREKILINGEEFEVRPNLCRFLNTARKYAFSGKIWIDAICLNQEDIVELGQQVSRMGKIYSSATSVVLWLDLTAEEIGVLRQVQNLILHDDMDIDSRKDDPTELWSAEKRRQCFNRDEFEKMRVTCDTIWQELVLRGIDLNDSVEYHEKVRSSKDVNDIHDCFIRSYARPLSSKLRGTCYLRVHPVIEKVHLSPYWRRMWIVQELTLAKRVQILGPFFSVDFLVIEPFLDWCNVAHIPYTYPRMSLERESKDERFDPNDFSRILAINEWRQCSRSRDRLYAVLSLTKDNHNIKVDYTLPDLEILWSVFSYQWHKHKDELTRGIGLDPKPKDKFHREQDLPGTHTVQLDATVQPLTWKIQILVAICEAQEISDVLVSLQYSLNLAPWHQENICNMSNLKQHIERQPYCAHRCIDIFDTNQIKAHLKNSDMIESSAGISALCGICIPIPDYENELVIALPTVSFMTNPTESWLMLGAGKVLQWQSGLGQSGRWCILDDHSTNLLPSGKSRR